MPNQPNALPPGLAPESNPAAISDADEILPRIRNRIRPPADQPLPDATANRKFEPLFIEYVATNSLIPYERKLRKHPQKHIAALMGSLRGIGFVAPVIVDDHNVIVDGEALIEAAARLDIETVPIVRLSNMTPELVRACQLIDFQNPYANV